MEMLKENIVKTNEEGSSMKKDKGAKGFLRIFSCLLSVFLILYNLGYIFGAWLASGTVRLEWMQVINFIVAALFLLVAFVGTKKEK